MAWTNRSHLVKMGGEFRHTGIDMVQAIAPNAFFVFASTFPTNNAVANLLLGAPVTFYQGLGDFGRDVGVWSASAYAQDEWRVTPRVTLNYGLRYERINPFTESRGSPERLHPRRAVDASGRTHREGLLFPGDAGIGRGIADGVHAFMPRVGVAWDPTGSAVWSVRAAYGVFYDQFQNGAGMSSQVAISATPWAQFVQFSGAGVNFQNPFLGRGSAGAGDVRPAVHGVRTGPRGEAAVGAELERERPALVPQSICRRAAVRRRQGTGPSAERRGEPRGVRTRRHGAERRPAARLRQAVPPMGVPARSPP